MYFAEALGNNQQEMDMKRWLIALLLVTGCSVPSEVFRQAADESEDCTLTQGYWKNHQAQWPVSALTLGAEDYDQAELLTLLHTQTQGDASLVLGHQLIAALLNVENGAAPGTSTQAALDDSQDWMMAYADGDGRLPYGVDGGSEPHETGTTLSEALDAFNNSASGSECGDPEPTGDDDDDDGNTGSHPFNTPRPDGDDDDDDDDDDTGSHPFNTPRPDNGDLD